MFGRKRKRAAEAAEARRREHQELHVRAKVEHAACDAEAHEEYEQLPAAGATKNCTKCGETNLARTLRNTSVGQCTTACAQASNATSTEWFGLSIPGYPHRAWLFEVLEVTCRSCGADTSLERPLDMVRIHESFARRNGMGVPVTKEGGDDE
jgi:hypothetical protein